MNTTASTPPTAIISIQGTLRLYVQEAVEKSHVLYTGNPAKARRYTPEDAATVVQRLPAKGPSGTVRIEFA